MAINDEIREIEKLLELKKQQIRAEQDITKQQQLQREARAFEKTLRGLKDQEKSLGDIERAQERIKSGFDDIGRAVGNIPLGQFIKFEKQTVDISSALAEVSKNIDKVVSEINEDFAKAKLTIPRPNNKEFKSVINELNSQMEGMGDDLSDALKKGDIGSFYKKYGEEGRKAAAAAMDKKKGSVGVLAGYFGKDGQGPKDLETFKQGMKRIEEEAKSFYKVTIDINGILGSMRRNLVENIGFPQIIRSLKEFDNSLSDLKRNFQIPSEDFKEAALGMAELTRKAARFGVSQQETFATIKQIGEEARTTNLKNLEEITQQIVSVPQATGIALQQVGQISGQMLFFGASADRISASFKSISNQSKIFGQQSTKVAQQFAQAYPKFKMMGMKGSDSAIAAMAAQAEKLGINLESSLQSSKNFLDIGEALESAADLSLLGGPAAQVTFADLMEARLDTKKMNALQDRIVSQLGRFNKATGEIDFGRADLVQLQEIASRLGVDYDVLYKRAKGQKEDLAKSKMFDKGMFSALSPEEKQFLLSKVVSKGGGKFEVEGFEGVKDLKTVSNDMVKAQMKKLGLDKKSLEDQAMATQSFDESVSALKNSFLTIFNALQPLLQVLTNAIVWTANLLNKLYSTMKDYIGPTWASAAMLIPVLLLTFGSMRVFSNIFTSAIGGMSKLFGKMIPGPGSFFSRAPKPAVSTPPIGGSAPDVGTSGSAGAKPPKKGPTFLQQFAKISPAQILSLAVAIVALGAAFMLIGKGIEFAANGLSRLVTAFKDTKNAGMALGAVTVVMGSFVGMMAIMIPLVRVLGTVGRTAAPGILAVGAALALMGYGINLASSGLATLVEAFNKTQNAGMALGAVAVVVGGFVAAIAVFATLGPAIGTSIGAIGSGIATALGVIGPALVAFAELMATPTPLGNVGLVIVGIALGLALAARIAAPAIAALGPMFTGLGDMFKGLAPLVEAAGSAIAKVVTAIGDGVVKTIKQAITSIKELSTINPLQLIGVAYGIGAIGLALASFGGGSLIAGAGRAIGEFFGGDPIKKLKEFAKIDGENLKKVSQAIKGLSSGLNSLNTVNLTNFSEQVDKLGKINSGVFKKLSDISEYTSSAKIAIDSFSQIARMLSQVPVVNLASATNMAESIETIGTKVKDSLQKLGGFGSLIQGSLAQFTIGSIVAIATSLNKIPLVSDNKINSLAKALDPNNIETIKKGTDNLSGGIFGYDGAKSGAVAIAQIGKSIATIPGIRMENISSLAQALGPEMDKIKKGVDSLGKGAVSYENAKYGAMSIAAIAKAFSAMPGIKVDNINSLSDALGRLSSKLAPIAQGFYNSAKAMASFNLQAEKAKAKIDVKQTITNPNVKKVGELATAPKVAPKEPAAKTTPGTASQGQIKIAPIQINLKLNGKDVQQMVVEAQYYSS